MAASNEIGSVCHFLAVKDITITNTNEWLKSCIEWFKEENVGCSIQQLQEFAYHQLLLADLNVVAEGCLPSTVTEVRSTNLFGKYFLQINYVLDVGKSAYSQFQRLHKRTLVNLEVTEEKQEAWEPQPSRMLKLELTDGISVVYGMEYSPIRKLDITLVPGSKIIIKGPVECRNGVIMLQDNNVTLLGGEVDCLYDCNHYNRIITKTLKLNDDLLPIADTPPFQMEPCPLEPSYNSTPKTQSSLLSYQESGSGSISTVTTRETHESTYNKCDWHDPQLPNSNDDLFADSDIFLNIPVDVNELNVSEDVCVKKKLIEINGSVTAFKSKLIIKDNNWHVTVRINSDEGSMKASFDPDLLDRLIGFSPIELSSKESEIAVNPAIKEKMNVMLKRGQQVIKNLQCHMTLVHEEGSEMPVIIAISDDNAFYDPSKLS